LARARAHGDTRLQLAALDAMALAAHAEAAIAAREAAVATVGDPALLRLAIGRPDRIVHLYVAIGPSAGFRLQSAVEVSCLCSGVTMPRLNLSGAVAAGVRVGRRRLAFFGEARADRALVGVGGGDSWSRTFGLQLLAGVTLRRAPG